MQAYNAAHPHAIKTHDLAPGAKTSFGVESDCDLQIGEEPGPARNAGSG